MSLAMEPVKVSLRIADAVPRGIGFPCQPPSMQELSEHNEQLARHNVLLLQQNDFLMKTCQHSEKGWRDMQLLSRALAGPPGLTHPMWENMVVPSGLDKERRSMSKESDVSTACSQNDEGCSTSGASETENERRFTQVVVKNLSIDCTRETFLNFVSTAGYGGKFNMIYLPACFETKKSHQYAFINFLSEEDAREFGAQFQGAANEHIFGQQLCDISFSECQGLHEIVAKYRNSPVMHSSVPDECKPLLFVDGRPVAFPQPTKKISKPRTNRRTRASAEQ